MRLLLLPVLHLAPAPQAHPQVTVVALSITHDDVSAGLPGNSHSFFFWVLGFRPPDRYACLVVHLTLDKDRWLHPQWALDK